MSDLSVSFSTTWKRRVPILLAAAICDWRRSVPFSATRLWKPRNTQVSFNGFWRSPTSVIRGRSLTSLHHPRLRHSFQLSTDGLGSGSAITYWY